MAILREKVPGVRALMLGPIEEDPTYFAECAAMVQHLGLSSIFEFKGRVKLTDYLGQVDVVVLTSLSEAQPLVLLEAGASGVPCVATDVGACREMIEGRTDEDPSLGAGGIVTPLADPRATAQALANLLLDETLRERCGLAMQARARRYYSKTTVDARYRALYEQYLSLPARTDALELET
jgi:glycosyltransferase involved in cell wall biosynthesis